MTNDKAVAGEWEQTGKCNLDRYAHKQGDPAPSIVGWISEQLNGAWRAYVYRIDGDYRVAELGSFVDAHAAKLAFDAWVRANGDKLDWRLPDESPAAPEFPRAPRDDEEREACIDNRANVRGGCSKRQPADGWWCSRLIGHTGDHIATGPGHDGHVLARWPQSPAAGQPARGVAALLDDMERMASLSPATALVWRANIAAVLRLAVEVERLTERVEQGKGAERIVAALLGTLAFCCEDSTDLPAVVERMVAENERLTRERAEVRDKALADAENVILDMTAAVLPTVTIETLTQARAGIRSLSAKGA